ncbi:hypothetical protein Tco_1035131, partial [Tanacetum coccineum]
ENNKVKRIRRKQPSIELQEAWYQLFRDVIVTRVDVVGPLVNASTFNDMYHVNAEDADSGAADDPRADFQYPDYTYVMKRLGRESASTLMFKEFMSEQNATHKHDLQLLLDSDTKDQVGKTNIDSVISVMNRMVKEKLIEECDDLWCFGMIVLEDPMKREFFLNFPVDACRVAWLRYFKCGCWGALSTLGETVSRAFHKVLEAINGRDNGFHFIYILAIGVSNMDVRERFQR